MSKIVNLPNQHTLSPYPPVTNTPNTSARVIHRIPTVINAEKRELQLRQAADLLATARSNAELAGRVAAHDKEIAAVVAGIETDKTVIAYLLSEHKESAQQRQAASQASTNIRQAYDRFDYQGLSLLGDVGMRLSQRRESLAKLRSEYPM
jgi:hypothetical protein